MRDFPIFPTKWGTVSLVLREIPYRREAYFRVLDVQPGQMEALLEECTSFCRAAGAEQVYASGSAELARCPLHTIVYRMEGGVEVRQPRDSLRQVTGEDVSAWREIYNAKMRDVDIAATLTAGDEPELLGGGAYFICHGETLLGIGWLRQRHIMAVAAVQPGAGERVMEALLGELQGEKATLEVASTNLRAIRLYQRLGMEITGESARWYKIYPNSPPLVGKNT